MTAVVATLAVIYAVAVFAMVAGIAAGYVMGWILARSEP